MVIATRGAVADVAGTACHGGVFRWILWRARWQLVEARDFYDYHLDLCSGGSLHDLGSVKTWTSICTHA